MTSWGLARRSIVEALKRLVRDGVIAGFRTNLYSWHVEGQVVVTVAAPEGAALTTVEHQVREALDPLHKGIVVRVELPISVEAGRCYLTKHGRVRRVVRILSDGRVQFEHRPSLHIPEEWSPGIVDLEAFGTSADRLVPCDWTPDRSE
jgi:hypothetical protein